MKCTVCGAEIHETDRFCGICGAVNTALPESGENAEGLENNAVLAEGKGQEASASAQGAEYAGERSDTDDGEYTFAQNAEAADFAYEENAKPEKERKTCSLWVAVLCGILIFILSVSTGIMTGLYLSERSNTASVLQNVEQS